MNNLNGFNDGNNSSSGVGGGKSAAEFMQANRKQWFIARIGERIFRNKMTCDCHICRTAEREGLIIEDRYHAEYLSDIEAEYNNEGVKIRYFDSMEEVEKYELEINLN